MGAAGLAVSLAWILRKGVGTIRRREVALVDMLLCGLPRIPGVTVYGPADPKRRGSAVSFRLEGMDPAEVGSAAGEAERRAGAGGAALLPERSPRPRHLPRRDRARQSGPFYDARGDRDVPVRPPEDPGSFRLISATRARIDVVERPGRNRIVFTVPPFARTTSAPTISLPFQSPPLTRTWGDHVADEPQRGVLGEDRHVGNAGKRGEKIGPVGRLLHRPAFPLQPPHGGVAVQPHDEQVAQRGRAPEILRVPRVQDIEASVGENDPLPLAPEAGAEGPHAPAGNHPGGRVFRYARGFLSTRHGILLRISSTTVRIDRRQRDPFFLARTAARRSPPGDTMTDPPE